MFYVNFSSDTLLYGTYIGKKASRMHAEELVFIFFKYIKKKLFRVEMHTS